MELEALAVAPAPVTTRGFEHGLEVIPRCLVRRDDLRLDRRLCHVHILPQKGERPGGA
jgi:hypothetical protein